MLAARAPSCTSIFGERMRFVFRHFPLREVHPPRRTGSGGGRDRGRAEKILAHARLAVRKPVTSEGQKPSYAEEAELDLERNDYEMSDHVYLQRVQEHIDGGTMSRVRSTPTFFVNGVVHDLSFGLEHLQQAIETVLAP